MEACVLIRVSHDPVPKRGWWSQRPNKIWYPYVCQCGLTYAEQIRRGNRCREWACLKEVIDVPYQRRGVPVS